MKTTLTIQESAELIKRGVSADKASKRVTRQVADSRGREIEKLRLKRWKDCIPYEKATMTNLHVGLMRFEHKEIFTFADLLSLLPKKITLESGINACLNIFMADDDYCVTSYTLSNNASIVDIGPCEPIDSFYRTLLWAIDHNHVKLD